MPFSRQELEEILEYELKRKQAKYNPFKFSILSVLLIISAKLYYFKYRAIIKAGKYDTICLWGGFHVMQKVLALIAKQNKIKLFYFENGILPNTTTMDAKGTNFFNSVPRNADFYKSIDTKFKDIDFVERKQFTNPSNYKTLPQNYIFCPFQDWLDSQILIHSQWVKNMEEFYEVIKSLASRFPHLYFVVKRHPSCPKFYTHLERENHPQIIFANENKTAELIQNSKAILTINSTVGMEGLMMKKKVITIGNSFYEEIGITKSAKNIQELTEVFKNLDSWQLNLDLLDKFLSYLQNYYLIPQSYKNCNNEHFEAVYKKLVY